MKISLTIGIYAIALALSGCTTSSTTIDSAWQSSRAETEPFNKVLVVALFPNAQARGAFETTLANEITASKRAAAVPSYTLFRQRTSMLTRDLVVSMAEQTQADAVIVTRILDQDFEAAKGQGATVVHLGPTLSIDSNEESRYAGLRKEIR